MERGVFRRCSSSSTSFIGGFLRPVATGNDEVCDMLSNALILARIAGVAMTEGCRGCGQTRWTNLKYGRFFARLVCGRW